MVNSSEVKNKAGHAGLNTKDAAMIALCAAVMAVCSWISIPAAVPFTMQTFGVFLAVGLLGGRNGTLAVLVYILLGAAGLPVYARDSGSIGLVTALSWCVFPYIIPDALKILLAAVLTRRLRPLIKG